METSAVIERVRRVAAVRADVGGPVDVAQSALVDLREVRAHLDASEADLVRRVAAGQSFPEASIAETSRESLNAASKTLDRARTLEAAPALANALGKATVTAGHVDVVTRVAKGLEPEQQARLFDRMESLVDVAAAATVEQFGRRVRTEASRILADDGMNRLERQRRDTSLSTWVDAEGMWNVRGRFDPVTGVSLTERLGAAVEAMFAKAVPESCPSDPVEKQKHLRALAFVRLTEGSAAGRKSGRPEFVAVIDVAAGTAAGCSCGGPNEGGTTGGETNEGGDGQASVAVSDRGAAPAAPRDGPDVQWPIPVEIPARVLADLMADAEVNAVIVRNGVVLHAPGELNLGRTTRLANRAQRRALRGLYRTCAIPGCATSYDRCKLHHIIWWRNGGRTDLDNLLPVCSHHHHKIHDDGWHVRLGPGRELTLELPDGTVRNTGPPTRRAA